jgi:uncharacterized membrane protein
MTRWVGRLIGLLILAALVLFPAVRWGSGGSGEPDDATITDYAADFVVAKDGRLSVTETLRVSFPGFKHGIFRFFDLHDPNDSRVRLKPQDIAVTRDGQVEPFEVLTEGRGRYRNVKIGSASETMSGEHVYVIRYDIDGVLAPDGDGSQFYWNLVPGGWQMPIERSHLTVHLPAEPKNLQCALGVDATSGCEAVPDGRLGFVVDTERLNRNTPVTIKSTLDLPAPERQRSAWPVRLDPVLGPSTLALVALLLVAAFAAWMGLLLAMQTREPKPQYPLMYAPPEGLGPAQASYLFTEQVGTDEFVASIMQASEKGATTLQRDDGWTITDTGDASGWGKLDPVSAYAATVLGVQGGSFTADTSVSAGKKLKTALSSFTKATKDWARQNKLMTTAGVGSFGGIMVVGAFLLTLFLAFANPFNISVVALIPGLFALFAAELLAPGSGTKRTAAGRELWSRIGGFRRVLATPSSEQRFDFSGRKELYTAYIPWAVAFGVADEWAEKYRIETGEDPPLPLYAASGFHSGSGGFASSMADDFSSTVGSAISAYEATQSSSSGSSGGGGGFSGGGGGGGGGGGSW